MSRNWKRAVSLDVSGKGGNINLSNLRIAFRVEQEVLQSPNRAIITVYNVSKQTADILKNRKEFDKVELKAGYEDNVGTIFRGTLKHDAQTGRETPTDTYIRFIAGDGDRGYNNATVNKTLPKGSTPRDVVDTAVEALKKYDLTLGQVPDKLLRSIKYPRPFVMFGMARDYMRHVDNSLQTLWSIQRGEIQIVTPQGPEGGDVFVLNSRTGLVGRPVQSLQKGVHARALINPKFDVNKKVKIDQASIERALPDQTYTGDKLNAAPYLADISADGLYWIREIQWTGDSRGQPWYADLSCSVIQTVAQTHRGVQ